MYKRIESATYLYAATGNAGLRAQMEAIIPIIAQAQEADGYIARQVYAGWFPQGRMVKSKDGLTTEWFSLTENLRDHHPDELGTLSDSFYPRLPPEASPAIMSSCLRSPCIPQPGTTTSRELYDAPFDPVCDQLATEVVQDLGLGESVPQEAVIDFGPRSGDPDQ